MPPVFQTGAWCQGTFLYVDPRFPRERRLHAPLQARRRDAASRRNEGSALRSPPQTSPPAARCSPLRRCRRSAWPHAAATSGGSDESAQQVINQTFSGKKKVDSGKLNLSLTREAGGHRRGRVAARGPGLAEAHRALPEPRRGQAARGRPRPERRRAEARTSRPARSPPATRATSATRAPTTRSRQDQFRRYKRQVERRRAQQNKDQQQPVRPRAASASTRATGSRTPRTRATRKSAAPRPMHISADVDVERAAQGPQRPARSAPASSGVQQRSRCRPSSPSAQKQPDRGVGQGGAVRPLDRQGRQDPAPARGRVRVRPAEGACSTQARASRAARSNSRSRSPT